MVGRWLDGLEVGILRVGRLWWEVGAHNISVLEFFQRD